MTTISQRRLKDAPTRRPGRIAMRIGCPLACALCVLAVTSCAPDKDGTVVARVGDQQITLQDLGNRMREVRGPSMLVDMIDALLIETAARQEDIEPGDSELNLRVQRAIAECGSEADFQATLAQRGTSRPDFIEELRRDLLLDKLAIAHMSLDEQEIQDFYREHLDQFALGERIKARMMLFPSREDAQAVREMLVAGGDFAGLAEALSSDPATRGRGGDMGCFERGDYAAEITDVAFALKPGELSEVFEAPDGWVVLKVEERLAAQHQPLEQVREQVVSQIRRAKLADARESWVRQARSEAVISIADDELRAATLALLKQAPAPRPVSLLPMPQMPPQ